MLEISSFDEAPFSDSCRLSSHYVLKWPFVLMWGGREGERKGEREVSRNSYFCERHRGAAIGAGLRGHNAKRRRNAEK